MERGFMISVGLWMGLFVCECDHVALMFRDKVVKKLAIMFPGLFLVKRKKGKKNRYKFLMLPTLLRPDIGTTDCLRQSDIMEKKADTSLFPVRTHEDLVEWAWVCVHCDSHGIRSCHAL